MKVKMNVSIAGHAMPEYGVGEFSFATGETIDLDDRLAAIWLRVGHCSLPESTEKPSETAVLDGEETTMLERASRKRRG